MRRSGPPQRRTPLRSRPKGRERPPEPEPSGPRTPLVGVTYERRPVRPPAEVTPRDRAKDFSAETRREVERRSGGRCEARAVYGCQGVASHHHHRQLRRGGDHRPVNDLHVCAICHAAIHGDPATAYDRGWMVRQAVDPATIPVLAGPPR